jgi:hypothetical protein
MFLFYGNKNKLIKTYYDPCERCKTCNNNGLDINVFESYFHLYWIPMHPMDDKNALVYCCNCDVEIFNREFADTYIAKTKSPLYMYTLLLLLGFFVLFISVLLIIPFA